MPDFVTLSCPSCGGKLNITNDIERFACGHCGREHIVKRAGGIVSLSPVVEALKKVEVGVDKTASELAINRLQREIDELRSYKRAFIASSPKPKVSFFFIWLIVFGLMAVVGSLATFDNNATYQVIGIGIIMVVIGVIPFFTHSSATHQWRETTGTQLSAIEKDIARRQEDLEYHRKVVARHA